MSSNEIAKCTYKMTLLGIGTAVSLFIRFSDIFSSDRENGIQNQQSYFRFSLFITTVAVSEPLILKNVEALSRRIIREEILILTNSFFSLRALLRLFI